MTPRIAVVYFSATGTTARMAEAAAEGAGAGAALHRIRGSDIVEGRFRTQGPLDAVDAADAVLFGSPTFMGGPAAEFKAFADMSSDRWETLAWRDKVAGGFTAGAYPNGDQSWTLAYFQTLAMQHAMLWCGIDLAGTRPDGPNRFGCQAGAVSVGEAGVPGAGDLAAARRLGERVAEMARRLRP